MNRKRVSFALKLAFSFGILVWVYSKLIGAAGVQTLLTRLANLSWGWLAFGYSIQLFAVTCSVLRWQRLLIGQGIHAPLKHLFSSFMIGRFFGEFAPGGWTGLNGYRIYDIGKYTGKVARATAAIGIEMVLGWISFSTLVLCGSYYGVRFIGLSGVLMVDTFFLGLIAFAVLLMSKPVLFRVLSQRLSHTLAAKLHTTADAVCAYQGKGGLVSQAVLLGIGTHLFRMFIYVASARALAAELSVGEVIFGSSLQTFATFMPASVNGIGLREATAVAVYTRGGVPESTAVLIPTLGFLMEVSLSSLGGVFFLLRRPGYQPAVRIEHAEHEEVVSAQEQLEPVPEPLWPRIGRGASLGFGAGLLAGAAIGGAEAAVIVSNSASDFDYGAVVYGMAAYAWLFGLAGLGMGVLSAWSGRVLQRSAVPAALAYARGAAFLTAGGAWVIGAFRIRRDVFHELLRWPSPKGVLVLGGCALGAVVIYVLTVKLLGVVLRRRRGALLLRPLGTPLCLLALLGLLLSAAKLAHAKPDTQPPISRPAAKEGAGNVLFVVVDTLRADHLPVYGYAPGKTPTLDRFATDAVRFEAAFANASWTRPSFASILSGRFPASHRTMAKNDALPDELVTLPEALRDGGYRTFGVVTNYNVAPFFNFHQGFDQYAYLEPNFVLGANDTAAKLSLIQAARQTIEATRAKHGFIEVGSAYQDAATVNRALLSLLDHPNPATAPFFGFVAYMDPHDPYYPHPYNGTAYSRAAHPKPKPEEAAELIKLYDGEISYWDQQFGVLLDELRKRGLYEDLTIVVTSDHGEEFNDHGGFWHGTTLYDEALHVPLLIKLPKNRLHGSVVRHVVQSIDLMPSLLALTGVAVPKGVQGQDLFSHHESVFAEESLEGNVLSALRVLRAGSAVKLIEANAGNPRGLPTRELFQLDRDPQEQVSVVAEDPELMTWTQNALQTQQRSAAEGHAAQRNVNITADSAAAERLRALGYTGR